MQAKKRILRKMAFIGLIVFVVSGLGLLISFALYKEASERAATQAQQNQDEQLRKYRSYLTETAKSITKLPVDPHIVGNVQARFFEEHREAHLYMWAMDTRGQFLFGVPSEVFARLNNAYDKYRTPIEEEGRFADRQEFIRRQVDDDTPYDWSRYVPDASAAPNHRRAPDWSWYEEKGWVFSTPFQNEDGQMLGNVYLKVIGFSRDPWYHNEFMEGPMAVSAALFIASIVFLWFLLPTWVYLDATARGMTSPATWSALTLVSLVFGLAAYLILRPEDKAGAVCSKCGRTATGGTFCAYCGTPVDSEFCQACGYPTRAEWLFCPNCQASLKPKPDEPPAGEAEPVALK